MSRSSADQTTCAAFWVKGIADTLEAAGLDIHALFEGAGLELTALSDADARFPTEGISLLWQLAVTRSGNPAIGLANSSVVKPGSFDVVAYAMMSSANLLGTLERVVRYVDIISDAATLTIADDREGHRLILELFGGKHPVPRQRFEFDLMTILSFCRWVTNRDLRPLAVELRFPPPADPQPYQDALNCPLRFNAPVNALLFAPTDVTLSLPTAHPELAGWRTAAPENRHHIGHERTHVAKAAGRGRDLVSASTRRHTPRISSASPRSEEHITGRHSLSAGL